MQTVYTEWIPNKDYPKFMGEDALQTLGSEEFLLPNETPNIALKRVARRASELLNMPDLKDKLYEHFVQGHIGLSTPIWTNFGTQRGLPISCFSSFVPDSLYGIYDTLKEVAIMTQKGGGTASYWGAVRDEGAPIVKNGGFASGPLSFLPVYDKTLSKVTQGKTRRGSHAVYQEFSSSTFWEWIKFKDVGSDIVELFPGICLQKEDIESIERGETEALKRWSALLQSKTRTGLPYIFFTQNANEHISTPPWYGKNTKYPIRHANLCTEIMLPTNKDESFVCDLASMNLLTYDNWKHTDAVRCAIYLLEAVMIEFIEKAEGDKALAKAVNFAKNHRALGLGVLGWHSFLQSHRQPFNSIFATAMTHQIFTHIKSEASLASTTLANIFGNCPVVQAYNEEYNKNFKRRNSTLLTIAPTTGNATMCGGVAAGIEPFAANVFIKKLAKGNFYFKNPFLEEELDKINQNTPTVWESIKNNNGSVQHLDFLGKDLKEVFLTFNEINQFELVKQAAVRQKYIDQGQSLNVSIHPSTPAEQVSLLYIMGAKLGIKSFYYQRSVNLARFDANANLDAMNPEACVSCAG
jgi:ribonucleoside-diphosphate reductase alpha chain